MLRLSTPSFGSRFQRCKGVGPSPIEGTSFEELNFDGSDLRQASGQINFRQRFDPDDYSGRVVESVDGNCVCNHLGPDGKCNAPVMVATDVTEKVLRAVTGIGIPACFGASTLRDGVEALSRWGTFKKILGDQLGPFMEKVSGSARNMNEQTITGFAVEAGAIAASNRVDCPFKQS